MTTLNLSDAVLKHKPWSNSKIDTAMQCQYRFHLKFIKKEKESVRVDPRQRIGTAAHQVLELVLKGEDFVRANKRAAVDQKLTTPEVDELLTYKGNILEFLQKKLPTYLSKNPINDKLVEYKFGLNTDLSPTSFWDNNSLLRGVFDLALHLKAEALIVIDHKSGEPKLMSEHDNQLNIYAIAAQSLKPTITGTQAAINYIKIGKVEWAPFVSKEHTEEKLVPWLVDRLNGAGELVTDTPKPTEGWWCSFCGYKPQCPAWVKK